MKLKIKSGSNDNVWCSPRHNDEKCFLMICHSQNINHMVDSQQFIENNAETF